MKSQKEHNEIEPFYQMRAKEIIDSMYDNKVFSEKMTRDDMQGYEDLIAFLFQSNAKSVRKSTELAQKLKHLKT